MPKKRKATSKRPTRATKPLAERDGLLRGARRQLLHVLQLRTQSLEELNASRKYWATIEKATRGRYLRGVELAIAMDAWSTYVRRLREHEGPEVDTPSPPKTATVPQEIAPSDLAGIAAVLALQTQGRPGLPIRDLLSEARELLIQAASFLKECSDKAALDFAHLDGVTFEEILVSNQKDNERSLQLLPGIIGGRPMVDKRDGTTAPNPDRFKGLAGCIRRFYAQHDICLTKQERKAVKDATKRELERVKDLTGEQFIAGKFLPTSELVKIRAWHFREKRVHALKTKRLEASEKGVVNKNPLPRTGTLPPKSGIEAP